MLLTALALVAAAPASASPPMDMPAQGRTEPGPSAPQHIRTADMFADFYRPAGAGPAPAILLLGGSEGGLTKGGAQLAGLLVARGYAVLHVSYFGSPGQSATLKAIPLETFTRALDWLKAQPGIAGDRIGILGTSKGAEAALLVAARRADLKIAVLGVPSSVAWPGIDPAQTAAESSWTEKGRPVPFTPYGWTGAFKGIYALYADGLADAAKVEQGSIPAERAEAAIVMICGEKDALWPSCPMARAVEARLKKAGYRHPVSLLAYPDAGHAAAGPPLDPKVPASAVTALGGTLEGNAAARDDSWPRTLEALDAALKPGAASTSKRAR